LSFEIFTFGILIFGVLAFGILTLGILAFFWGGRGDGIWDFEV